MAFERLQNLGIDKFTRICNELVRGTPALRVARLIQQEWRDAQDVGEQTLGHQLLRLRTAISNAAFGGELAKVARQNATVKIKRVHGSTLDCLDELERLADMQRARLLTLYERERTSRQRVVGLNKVLTDYRHLLLDLQKVRFDLGLDPYKRGFPTAPETAADRTTTDRQVSEALSTAEEILATRFALKPGEP